MTLTLRRKSSHSPGCMRLSPASHCCHVRREHRTARAASDWVIPAALRASATCSGVGLEKGPVGPRLGWLGMSGPMPDQCADRPFWHGLKGSPVCRAGKLLKVPLVGRKHPRVRPMSINSGCRRFEMGGVLLCPESMHRSADAEIEGLIKHGLFLAPVPRGAVVSEFAGMGELYANNERNAMPDKECGIFTDTEGAARLLALMGAE